MNYRSPSRKVFEVFNTLFFVLFSLSILVPFLNAVAISLSSYDALAVGKVGLLPKGFSWDAYQTLALNKQFLRTFANTIGLTAINTALTILIALAAGYALAHKHLLGKGTVFLYLIVPMYFSGGLIPLYLLVNQLHLTNTYWALILPQIVSTFYIIIFRNQINQLPQELIESAEMDGAGDFRILWSIILPLVLPMTMAFVVFSAVAFWNEWFHAMIFIRERSLWTLQLQLRDILINTSQFIDNQTEQALIAGGPVVHPQNMKMAALMLTILPIIIIYPFVQKYFIHGQLVGAVKG